METVRNFQTSPGKFNVLKSCAFEISYFQNYNDNNNVQHDFNCEQYRPISSDSIRI